MLLVIAEVVDVANHCPLCGQNFREKDLAFSDDFAWLIVGQVGHPIPLLADQKFVQVAILPPHCDLDNPMQLPERGLAG